MNSISSYNASYNGMNLGLKIKVKALILFLIRSYQRILSPYLPAVCRFEPTCSHYALDCFQSLSLGKATWLTLKRISRCHPYCNGGYDPVPDK